MLRAFWFLIKISLVVAGALWLLERDGDVMFSAFGYTATIQTGLFLLGLCVALSLLFYVYQALAGILSIPQGVGNFWSRRQRDKGYRDMTRGFVAVAVGDGEQALRFAARVRDALPNEQGLSYLLSAQAARLNGREGEAAEYFEKLLENKDAAFLGIKGLLNASIHGADQTKALGYARKALALHPKQAWVLKTAYAMEIKNKNWREALDILKRAEKNKAITADAARSDRVAIHMIEAEGQPTKALDILEKAYRLDPLFVPLITRLAALYRTNDKPKKIIAMVEKAFPLNPHPDFVALWDELAPRVDDKKDGSKLIKWYEKLISLNSDTDLSHLAAARVCLKLGMIGEARAHIKNAEKIQTSFALFKLKSDIEEKAGGDSAVMKKLMEHMAAAPPSRVWVCGETGVVYSEWMPIAAPHGSFNTIVWDFAGRPRAVPHQRPDLLIDAA